MSKSKWTVSAMVAAMLLTMVAGFTVPVTAEAAAVRLRTKLTGPAIGGEVPHGVAKFRERANGNRRFSTEVEDVNLPAGTVLHVFVNSTELGTITLSALQKGELEVKTRDGGVVPPMAKGDVVTVKDSGNITILSGTF
jgi:hypothetical protein